jgi:hypothetical protein
MSILYNNQKIWLEQTLASMNEVEEIPGELRPERRTDIWVEKQRGLVGQ